MEVQEREQDVHSHLHSGWYVPGFCRQRFLGGRCDSGFVRVAEQLNEPGDPNQDTHVPRSERLHDNQVLLKEPDMRLTELTLSLLSTK